MGILDNFEAWVDLSKVEESLTTKIFKEEVCDNCGCKSESNSEDLLSPKDPR